MKVRVHFDFQDRKIDETLDVATADALLVDAKARVARELGWKGLFLNAISPIQFAQTAVKMYNEKFDASYPAPQTAEEFLTFGQQTGHLEVIEP